MKFCLVLHTTRDATGKQILVNMSFGSFSKATSNCPGGISGKEIVFLIVRYYFSNTCRICFYLFLFGTCTFNSNMINLLIECNPTNSICFMSKKIENADRHFRCYFNLPAISKSYSCTTYRSEALQYRSRQARSLKILPYSLQQYTICVCG